MTDYIDLTLLVIANNGEYEVRASSADIGDASEAFVPPFSLRDIGPGLLGPGARRGGIAPIETTSKAAPKSGAEIGVALFESLFHGKVLNLLSRAETKAKALGGEGVRIRLNFDLNKAASAEVAALPWELMRRRNMPPLVVSTETVLVRSLDVEDAQSPPANGETLRVLMISSNPAETEALAVEQEGNFIADRLARLPGVIVDRVPPRPRAIKEMLDEYEYAVVHYMGHGDFAAEKGGMLALENDDGSSRLVSAETFSTWLWSEPLRLVFLNACDTGTTPDVTSLHPFAGLATALVSRGVPAVVAMQFPITDDSALRFAETFYTRIVRGDPVDKAVARARLELFDDDNLEWATPVLYMRARDGNLFGKADNLAPLKAPEPTPAPQALLAPHKAQRFWERQGAVGNMAIGALLLIALLIAVTWNEETEPTNSATEAATANAEAEPSTIAGETGPAAIAINNLPSSIWINDEQGEEAHVSVINAMKRSHPEMTDGMIAAEIKKLSDAGYPEAQYIMARIYDAPALGLPQSSEEANELLRIAADNELAAAQYLLGRSLLHAEGGMEKDVTAARNYLQKAAGQGSRGAQEELDNPENWR